MFCLELSEEKRDSLAKCDAKATQTMTMFSEKFTLSKKRRKLKLKIVKPSERNFSLVASPNKKFMNNWMPKIKNDR